MLKLCLFIPSVIWLTPYHTLVWHLTTGITLSLVENNDRDDTWTQGSCQDQCPRETGENTPVGVVHYYMYSRGGSDCQQGEMRLPADSYCVSFSHLFTELQIHVSPIEVHISPIEFEISAIELHISPIQLNRSPNLPIWRYLQFNWRDLQFNWRYLQFNCRYLQICRFGDISNSIRSPTAT